MAFPLDVLASPGDDAIERLPLRWLGEPADVLASVEGDPDDPRWLLLAGRTAGALNDLAAAFGDPASSEFEMYSGWLP